MIYLISNCTNSKKINPKEDLSVVTYSNQSLEKTIIDWKKSIYLNTDERFKAKDLYKGHSWQETLKSVSILSQVYKTKLLISSAGYGLIDENEKINSYQSTFSKGNENSIHNFKDDYTQNPTLEWWDSINKFDISEMNKDAYVFINVSYEYLIAMQNTIKKLIQVFGSKLFIIVLSKEVLPDIYKKNILRFDTRFNSFDKGTISSIIPRFTKWLFNEVVDKNLILDNAVLQKHIDNFLSKYSEYSIPKRKQLSDLEISNIILEQLKSKKIASKSKGLKDFREQGLACSQDRYGKLFSQIKGNLNG